jgi:hypothetical protein
MVASSKINDSPGHFMVLQAIARGLDTVDKIATATRKSKDDSLLGVKQQELRQSQERLQQVYDSGDKQQLQSYMDSNRM